MAPPPPQSNSLYGEDGWDPGDATSRKTETHIEGKHSAWLRKRSAT